jgi:hypothetical protein
MLYKNLKFFYTSFSDVTQGAPHINKKGSSAGIYILVLVLFEEQQQKKKFAFYTTTRVFMGKEEHSSRT